MWATLFVVYTVLKDCLMTQWYHLVHENVMRGNKGATPQLSSRGQKKIVVQWGEGKKNLTVRDSRCLMVIKFSRAD